MSTLSPRTRTFFGDQRWTERTISAIHARHVFMETVVRVTPDVLQDLERSALPGYAQVAHDERFKDLRANVERDLFIELSSRGEPHVEITPWATITRGAGEWGQIKDLRDDLRNWASAHRLDEDWVLEIASETLDRWHEGCPRSQWYYPGWNPSPRGALFSFVASPFDPRTDSDWGRWKRSLFMSLRRAIAEYRASTLHAVAANTPETPFKDNIEHFEWLVHFQIRDQSHSSLSSDLGKDPKTVREAIRSTAQLIGLTLRRPSPPGRPRKS